MITTPTAHSDSLIGPGSRTTTGVNRARKQSWRRDIYGNPVYAFVGNGSYVGVLYDRAGRVRHRFLSDVGGGLAVDGERYLDPAGQAAVDSLYLGMGRVLSAGQRHTSYYDNKGRLETASTDDTYLSDNVVMQRFGYTDPGALRGDTTIFGDGATVRRAYEYNRRGQRTRVTDTLIVAGGSPSGDTGGELRYQYDSLTSRLTAITSLAVTSGGVLDSLGTISFLYDAGGRDSLRTTDLKGAGNLVTRLTTYNTAGRVAGVSVKSGATVRYQLSGTSYSPLGELRAATEWKRTLWGDLTFLYDSVYGTRRLLASTSDVSGQEYAYTYDVFGNRLSEIHNSTVGGTCGSDVDFTYGTDSRLLTKSQSGTCTPFRRYITDQAGMRVAELDSLSGYAGVKAAMTYTAAGQLYYAMTPQATVGPYDHAWHWYDASGQRIMSHLAIGSTLGASVRPDSAWGTRTYYINDGPNVALTLVKGASSWRIHQRYLSTGLDEMAAVRISINGTPTNVATVGDRQNGFIMAVDFEGGEVPEAGFYVKGPFGQQEPGTSAATSGHTGLGFTGAGAPNTSGGYVYLRNRWYDPGTGRFLSQDPIGLAGGVNLYAYAGNNPTTYSDPFGLCPPCTPEEQAEIFQGVAERVEPLNRVVPAIALGEAVIIAPMAIGMSGGIAAGVSQIGTALASSTNSLLQSGGLATRVAGAVGGTVSALAKSKGFKVTVEGANNIVARIKSTGDMRVSIDRVGSLTREGIVSADRALTHLRNLSTQDLTNLIEAAKAVIGVPR